MRNVPRLKWPALASLLLFTSDVLACPMCHTGTGKAVRAGIFAGGDFLFNLFVVLAPFPVLALIVRWIHNGPPAFLARFQKAETQSPDEVATVHEIERVKGYGDAS